MGSLDVLARLAKQAVDQERLGLQRINAAIAEVTQRIDKLEAVSQSEAAEGADFMTIGATLPAYLRANKQRIRAAAAQLQKLQTVQAEQLLKLQQQRVELKRYERLVERRTKRQALEIAAKQQKTIDDLVMIKAGRSPGIAT